MPPPNKKRRSNLNEEQNVIVPPTTDNLLQLNEDCLLEIFSYLKPLDVCAVKDTCHRLREVAETYMETFYKSKVLTLSDGQTNGAFKQFIKFGHVLTSLNIRSMHWHHQRNNALNLAFRQCNPKLVSLTLTYSNCELPFHRLRPLVRHLRKIQFEYLHCNLLDYRCDIRREQKIKEFLTVCTNLEELTFGAQVSVWSSCYQGIFLQQKFKNLRSLQLREVREFDLNNLKLFCKWNPNVQRLLISCCASLRELSQFHIPQHAPNIEGVSLKFSTVDRHEHEHTHLYSFNQFHQLKRLKYLALDTCRSNITNFIRNFDKQNSLLYLSLTNVELKLNEGLGEAFASLKQLKVLRLHLCVYFYYVGQNVFKMICKNLDNLEELFVTKTVMQFSQIADIVENSVNLKRLYLPTTTEIINGVVNEQSYLELVALRSRKKLTFPLTLYFENKYSYLVVMTSISTEVLRTHRNVINISKFNPSDFNEYDLPDTV